MAASNTEIANMALIALGQIKTIGSLDTENSTAANVFRRLWDITRDDMLAAAPWSFAVKTASLVLVAQNPTLEWSFSYTYPSDCMYFQRIQSGVRNDTSATRVPYRVVSGLIYTDMMDAIAEYTFQQTDVSKWTPDFTKAFVHMLAAKGAAVITGGDPFKLGPLNYQLAQKYLSEAKVSSAVEEQPDLPADSEMISGR